jgi:hypothetical protein
MIVLPSFLFLGASLADLRRSHHALPPVDWMLWPRHDKERDKRHAEFYP